MISIGESGEAAARGQAADRARRNSPPVRRKTPMLSSPPSTITTPETQRTRGPKRRSNSSGNRHHAGIAQRLDAESGDADDQHRQRLEYAGRGAGEPVLVARLRGVHAGDDAELGGGQRRDAEIDVHLAAGDEEVFHLADAAPHHEAGGHGCDQVQAHDRAVERSERHAVRSRAAILRRPSSSASSRRSSANCARARSRLWPSRCTLK